MAVLEGDRSPEKRRARVRLGALEPVSEGLLAGLPYETDDLHGLRAFCKKWVRDRNAFSIGRARRGLFGSRRLDRSDADRALKQALADLATGAAQ